jgi:hypothetical protein
MKKGCFIKAIIILTIIVASITYILQNKFNDFIFKPGKKIILPLFVNEFKSKLNSVKESPQKDSLYVLIKNYIEDAKNMHDLSDENLKPLVVRFGNIIADSAVTTSELNSIRDYLNSKKRNEGSKKN